MSSRPNQRWLRRSAGCRRGRLMRRAPAARARPARARSSSRGRQRRDIRRDWTCGRDAGQLGRVVQHARRAPGVAEILERHEVRARTLPPASSSARRTPRTTRCRARGAMQPEPVVRPASPKSRRWTTAGRSPMPLMTRVRSTRRSRPSRYASLTRVVANDRVLDGDGHAVVDQPADRIEARLSCRSRSRPRTSDTG